MISSTATLVCALLGCGLLAAAQNVSPRAGVGGSCTDKSQCSTLYAECIDGVCKCNISDIHVGNKCFRPVGGRCQTRDCDADNSICTPDKFCVCKPNFVQTENNTYCYEEPNAHNEYCEKDHDCRFLSDQGRCIRNRCRCSSDTAYDENQCKTKIDQLGSSCNKETQACYLERDGDNQKVECKDNKCTCKKGAKPSKDNQSCGGAGTLEALSFSASFLALLLAKMLS